MRAQPKVIDQLATIVKVEPLSNGGAEVTLEYSDWGSVRLTPGQLVALRQAAGLPAEAGNRRLLARSVMEQREVDGRVGFAPLLPFGTRNEQEAPSGPAIPLPVAASQTPQSGSRSVLGAGVVWI